MHRSSPRASAGLSMFEASTEPSAAPAPTTVWSSSMKRTMLPSASAMFLSTALSRSSNSPRYLLPATSAPMSSATSRLFLSPSGTSPLTMRCASPSAMAVLPTPGSPMRTGLFFVRRERTWMTRRISSSRPMTGSSLPLRASSVRSRLNRSSAWYLLSGSGSVTRWLPRMDLSASSTRSRVTPAPASSAPVGVSCASARAMRRCSVLTYSSLSRPASSHALSSAVLRYGET